MERPSYSFHYYYEAITYYYLTKQRSDFSLFWLLYAFDEYIYFNYSTDVTKIHEWIHNCQSAFSLLINFKRKKYTQNMRMAWKLLYQIAIRNQCVCASVLPVFCPDNANSEYHSPRNRCSAFFLIVCQSAMFEKYKWRDTISTEIYFRQHFIYFSSHTKLN